MLKRKISPGAYLPTHASSYWNLHSFAYPSAVSRQFGELWTEAYGRRSCRYVDDFAKRTRHLECDHDCDYDYADDHDHDYDYDHDYEYDPDYDFECDNLCNMSLFIGSNY